MLDQLSEVAETPGLKDALRSCVCLSTGPPRNMSSISLHFTMESTPFLQKNLQLCDRADEVHTFASLQKVKV